MYTCADQNHKGLGIVVANCSKSQNNTAVTSKITDNRSETVQATELQAMVNHNPQAGQATQLQAMAEGFAARYQPPVQKKPGSSVNFLAENKKRHSVHSGKKPFQNHTAVVQRNGFETEEEALAMFKRICERSDGDTRKLYFLEFVKLGKRKKWRGFTEELWNIITDAYDDLPVFAPVLSGSDDRRLFAIYPQNIPAANPLPALALPPAVEIEADQNRHPGSANVQQEVPLAPLTLPEPPAATLHQNTSIATINWDQARVFKTISSGHGGVVIFELPDRPGSSVVVKQGNDPEVYASRIAGQVGLTVPETRKATKDEESMIRRIQPHVKAPYLIMEYIEGTTLGELKNTRIGQENANIIVESIGKWLAFDTFISEQDRFGVVSGMGGESSINSSNLMFDLNRPEKGLTGIDQFTSRQDTGNLIRRIKEKKTRLGYSLGQMLSGQLHTNDATMGEEELGDKIMDAAEKMLDQIKSALTEEDLRRLREGLTIVPDIIERLERTLIRL